MGCVCVGGGLHEFSLPEKETDMVVLVMLSKWLKETMEEVTGQTVGFNSFLCHLPGDLR